MKPIRRSYFIIAFLAFLFLLRAVVFAGQYGGMENDSGWLLGVAKNIAERGIYASSTNTVVHEGAGAFPSIHKRFSIQDKKGYVYFPAAISVGPGYQLPEALIIKVFGNGWWQYRAWPLISFTLLFALLFYTAWRLGGYLALALFSAWLWLLPQLYIEFAYEAYAESIALMYFLAGCLLLYWLYKTKHTLLFSGLAGILFAFSFLTKTIFLLPITGVSVFFMGDVLARRQTKRELIKKWLVFVIVFLIPILVFYLYEYGYVMSRFGASGWSAVQNDYRLEFIQAGSGINLLGQLFRQNAQLLYAKFQIWMDVGSNLPLMFWLAFLAVPFVLLRYLRSREKSFGGALYASAAVSFLWFLFLSPDGFGRHVWQGLILAMMLLCVAAGLMHQHYRPETKQIIWATTIGLLLVFTNYRILYPLPLLPQTVARDWLAARMARGVQGFPPSAVFPLADQKEMVGYFSRHITGNDRIYYIAGFLNAEVSALTGNILFPLARYEKSGNTNTKSYLITGAYERGPYSMVPANYTEEVKKKLCQDVVFQNASYMLCTLR